MRRAASTATMLTLFAVVCGAGCGGAGLRAPEALSYPVASALYVQGVAITPNVPAVTNPVSSWSVSPPLPAGLALDAATGVISGTPTVAQGGTDYTITAANASGSTTASVNVTVKPAGRLSPKIVHFFDSAGWGAVNLSYSADGGAWTAAPGVAMASEGAGWFAATIPASHATELSFNNVVSALPSLAGDTFRNSWDEVWVKNGLLFTYDPDTGASPAGDLTFLTLNLHTYQELAVTDGGTQTEKLNRVADAIAALGADFVLLEECAQNAGAAVIVDPRAHLSASGLEVLKADNMAYLISKRLSDVYGLTYDYAWSWAHYGFTIYEEGVAILTRHPIDSYDNTYISTSTSQGDPLGSRKAIHVSTTLPGGKVVNAFAVHVSFTGPEQDRQLDALRSWMAGKAANGAVASVVGGDFNMEQGTRGYLRMTSSLGGDPYVDSSWAANPEGYFDSTIQGGGRIDYVFYKLGDALTPLTGQLYFKIGDPYLGARVSDHNGTIVRLRLGN